MSRIGFLGMGRMGLGMATCLLRAGHDVSVWNRSPGKAGPAVAAGAHLAATPAEAAQDADAVFAMLADDPASRDVWLGEHGAMAVMRPGTFAIECSTLTRRHVLQMAQEARDRKLRFIDCPVTGRPDAAAAGNLTMLVGAEDGDLEAIRPLLLALGPTIRNFGPVGAGTGYKLMINLMGAVQIAALAEGIAFAEKLGLAREAVVAAIDDSAAASRQVVYHARRMAERHFENPTFTAALRHKDAAYALELAEEAKAAAPLGFAALEWFASAKLLGDDVDEGRVVEIVSERCAGCPE